MHEPLRRKSIQKTIIVSAIFLLFAGTNLAVAKPLNFVYQTTQIILSTPRNSVPAKTRGLRLMLITELG
ncbi:hypothetical protein, partial [Xanthomonas campestris]